MQIGWPIHYAKSLNDAGLDVVFLGLDSAGELVVTHVSNGHVQSIEQPRHNRSFHLRMLTWLEDYPRKYGYVEAAEGDDEFFITMERLGGKTAYRAWISTQEGPEANGTLGRALERLGGTFDDFGFTIDNGRQLPPDMSDAKLAVITAHGGLTAEGRYIHSIRDEDHLFEAPTALAAALAGVEVVILFVCSGGRIDKHPWGNTTVGLPKLLLDKGCRVVIASPWPLDVKVTDNWLDPFLREWESGATALQATKKANEEVAHRLGKRPQYSLGMIAYGDVLLTK
jgi:hypothetical protein